MRRRLPLPRRPRPAAIVLALALGVMPRPAIAQTTPPRPDYFVPPRSLGTAVEPAVPRYVRPARRTSLPGAERLDWLDVGLDYRVRVEFRHDDFRRPTRTSDTPVMLRTRAYLGVTRALDPLRVTLEVEDARRVNSQFALDTRDVNTVEPIQALVELHFAQALGPDRPLVARAGRFAFEALDRRLISRNEWRNTTNTFEGLRVSVGQRRNDWSADVFTARPIERRLRELDRPERDTWLTGAIGAWRRWSSRVTLEPYYVLLVKDEGPTARRVHTTGLRAFGPAGSRGLDYDVSGHRQVGRSGAQPLRAWAGTAELGLTLDHPWAPRAALFYGYVSGDGSPADLVDGRFERLYGFARPWSSNDYFQMENLSTPKLSLELTPMRGLAIDGAYVAFWLASTTDRWSLAGLRDPDGASGRFLGHEFNVRARYPLTSRLGAHVGYASFVPGAFPRALGKSQTSQFLYVELAVNAFR